MTFLGSVMVRSFLEFLLLAHVAYWQGEHVTGMLVHYTAFYLALGLTVIIGLKWLTGQEVMKVLRVVLLCFPILIIVPIIDTLFGFRDAFRPGYFVVGQYSGSLLSNYLTFFGPFKPLGVTPGMRVEILLMAIMSGVYVWLMSTRPWRALLGAVVFYSICFGYLILPVLLDMLHLGFDPNAPLGNIVFMKIYLLMCFGMASYIFFLAKPRIFEALLTDLRLERLGFFVLLVFLGIACCMDVNRSLLLLPQAIFELPFVLIALSLAFIFSVITNNLADRDIDQVSNPKRPTITGIIPEPLYKSIAWGCLAGALLFSVVVSSGAFLITSAFIGSYFLYSLPPVRFKRLPVFSKMAIGLNSLLMFIQGYILAEGTLFIPAATIIFFLMLVSLSANLIDLKDVAGDRAAGIKTLPVLIGERWAKQLIGFLLFLTWVGAFFVFNLQGCFWLVILAAIGQYVLINWPWYSDLWVILSQIAGLFFIMVYKFHGLFYAIR
jgi:4-hydroxybenzoate polyprenyltransferase